MGSTKEILIIEDEIEMRFYLMTMVRSLGFEARIAKNGVQGLAALEADQPDMIILDIMMPEKGGALVYQELVKAYPDIPVLIFSGVDPAAFDHYVKMLNVSGQDPVPQPKYFVEKSADPDYLKAMIQNCMEKKEL